MTKEEALVKLLHEYVNKMPDTDSIEPKAESGELSRLEIASEQIKSAIVLADYNKFVEEDKYSVIVECAYKLADELIKQSKAWPLTP